MFTFDQFSNQFVQSVENYNINERNDQKNVKGKTFSECNKSKPSIKQSIQYSCISKSEITFLFYEISEYTLNPVTLT